MEGEAPTTTTGETPMKFHHTQIKALAAIGFTPTETGARRTEDGHEITAADAKATIQAAREAPAPKAPEPTPAEQPRKGTMRIAKVYRDRYDAHDSNGDQIAEAMRAATAGNPNGIERTTTAIANANGIMSHAQGQNPGHTRMIVGNMIRGLWRRGYTVVIGSHTIEPTAQARANRAAREAEAQAKAERKAQKRAA